MGRGRPKKSDEDKCLVKFSVVTTTEESNRLEELKKFYKLSGNSTMVRDLINRCWELINK